MSIIAVIKSSPVLVRPSEPGTPPVCTVQLSSLDKCVARLPITSLLVFDQPIDEPAESIKVALSRALVHYYPVSGRLAADDDGGEIRIVCTGAGEGQGVQFVGASASCALRDVPTDLLRLQDLALRYPANLCGHADPLLLMQVTVFSCGGFVLGVTWNHGLADGAGMGQFLQAVGDFARGMSAPSIAPARSPRPGRSTWVAAAAAGYSKHAMTFEPTKDSMVFLDVTVPWSLIGRVRAELAQDCTAFEAVAAVLWQCRTRAVMSDPVAPTCLTFAGNARRLVGASVEGYYGNCFVVQSVPATSGQVANAGTGDVVKLIRSAKEMIPRLVRAGGGEAAEHLPLGYNKLVVSSWRNVGLDAADMGGGRPARVMWHAERANVPGCVVCPPCKGKDGVNIMSMCVTHEHTDAFLRELLAMARA